MSHGPAKMPPHTFSSAYWESISEQFSREKMHESGGFMPHAIHLATSMPNPFWWINRAVGAAKSARAMREILQFHALHPSRTPNPEIFRLAFADLVKSPFYHQGRFLPGDSAPVKMAAEMQVRAIEELRKRIHEEMKAKKDAFELKGRLSATELDYLLGDAKKRAGLVSHYSSLVRRLWSEGHTQGEGGTIEHERELAAEAKNLAQIAINHATLYGRLSAEFEKLAKEKV